MKIILAVLLVTATSSYSQTLVRGDYIERKTDVSGSNTNINLLEIRGETDKMLKHKEKLAKIQAKVDIAKAKAEAEGKKATSGGFWRTVFAPSPHHWNSHWNGGYGSYYGGGNVFGAQSPGGFTTSAPNVHTHGHSSHDGGGNVFGAQSPRGFTTSAPNNVW